MTDHDARSQERYARYRERYEQEITRAAVRYAEGLQERGMQAHPILTRAAAQRAHREALAHVEQETFEEMEEIRHTLKMDQRARRRWPLFFPAMGVLWTTLAVLSVEHPGWFVPGAYPVFAIAAVVCTSIALIGPRQPS